MLESQKVRITEIQIIETFMGPATLFELAEAKARITLFRIRERERELTIV